MVLDVEGVGEDDADGAVLQTKERQKQILEARSGATKQAKKISSILLDR